MKARFTPAGIVGICLLIVLLIPGCTGDFGYDNNRFVRLLGLIPAEAVINGGVIIIDYERIWNEMGIEADTSPTSNVTADEFLYSFLKKRLWNEDIFYSGIVNTGSFYTGWSKYTLRSIIRREYVGYQVTQVSAETHPVNAIQGLSL